MIYIIKHNSLNYLKGGLKLWVYRVMKRFYPQRKSLTILCGLISFLCLITSINAFIIFIIFIIFILFIDLLFFIYIINKTIKDINIYISNDGEDLQLVSDSEFIYFRQYSKEFQKTKWSDIKEIYILKNPSLISFKNKFTHYEYILYEKEFENNFKTFVKEVLDKTNVVPLVNHLGL